MTLQRRIVYHRDMMKLIKNIMLVLSVVLIDMATSDFHNKILARENTDVTSNADFACENEAIFQEELSPDSIIAANVSATGYYCIYECEMEGSQTISKEFFQSQEEHFPLLISA